MLSENVTPVNLESPDPIDFNNKFPYSEAELSFFHVAKQRRVDLNNLAFCFGGSALHMLAYKESSDFIVSRVTGTRCSLVANRRTYNKDNGLFGFQFERHYRKKDGGYFVHNVSESHSYNEGGREDCLVCCGG